MDFNDHKIKQTARERSQEAMSPPHVTVLFVSPSFSQSKLPFDHNVQLVRYQVRIWI